MAGSNGPLIIIFNKLPSVWMVRAFVMSIVCKDLLERATENTRNPCLIQFLLYIKEAGSVNTAKTLSN